MRVGSPLNELIYFSCFFWLKKKKTTNLSYLQCKYQDPHRYKNSKFLPVNIFNNRNLHRSFRFIRKYRSWTWKHQQQPIKKKTPAATVFIFTTFFLDWLVFIWLSLIISSVWGWAALPVPPASDETQS